MLFTRIYDEDLAQASYFIGCHARGAVVVDPAHDITVYLKEAENNGMTIVAVTETHIHADYLSGSGSWRRQQEPLSTSPTKGTPTGNTASRAKL